VREQPKVSYDVLVTFEGVAATLLGRALFLRPPALMQLRVWLRDQTGAVAVVVVAAAACFRVAVASLAHCQQSMAYCSPWPANPAPAAAAVQQNMPAALHLGGPCRPSGNRAESVKSRSQLMAGETRWVEAQIESMYRARHK
jgi:hypothetical protein